MVFIKEVEADVAERYGLVIERIQNIKIDDTVSAPYRDYFVKVADFMLYLHELLMLVDKDEFRTLPMDELKAHNDRMFEEIRSRNYDTSYTNPEYAVKTLGQEYGQYLCDLLLKIRATHTYAMEHRVLEMTVVYELFVEIYNIFESEELSVQAVKDAVYWHVSDYQDLFLDYQIRSIVDGSLTFYKDIVMDSDLSDLRYLYWYGYNITDNEIEIARFLNSRTEAEIDDMAATCTEGFVRGFVLGRKDLSKKKTVNIYMPIGFERMVRKVVERLGKSGLDVIIRDAGVSSTVANKQYQFDHKFNIGLYMDKAYVDRRLSVAKVAFEKYKDMATLMAGPIAIETFGETPFEPVAKKEAIKLDAKQQKLH